MQQSLPDLPNPKLLFSIILLPALNSLYLSLQHFRIISNFLKEMVYSIAERVEMVKLYFQNNSCARVTARLFNNAHPDKSVSDVYVGKLLQKFSATGSVCNKKHQPQRPVRNEDVEVAILGHIALDPTTSTRRLSEASGVSRTSAMRILKSHKYFPYKIRLVHELNDDDPDRRLQFCEEMSQRLIDNPDLLFNICFSDECTFYLNGAVNRHNCRYWDDSNPHLMQEVHTQHPQKLNVWCGIFGNTIIGPIFIPGNLTGEMYENMLEEIILPQLIEIAENYPNHNVDTIHFQQDGAPPHYVAPVRQFLDTHFPGRWIGRRGPIEWPPRSPDLSPLDYFLWGHLKSTCYITTPDSIEDLRERIITECRRITPEILENVRNRFEQNLYSCMEANGAQFQHLLQ